MKAERLRPSPPRRLGSAHQDEEHQRQAERCDIDHHRPIVSRRAHDRATADGRCLTPEHEGQDDDAVVLPLVSRRRFEVNRQAPQAEEVAVRSSGEAEVPMPDKAHAVNAKARAKQQRKRGKLSKTAYDKIVRKADRVIRRSKTAKKKRTS